MSLHINFLVSMIWKLVLNGLKTFFQGFSHMYYAASQNLKEIIDDSHLLRKLNVHF